VKSDLKISRKKIDVQSQKKTGKSRERAAKICGNSGPTPVACGWLRGAKAPPLAARPKQRALDKIPGQMEALFLIFLTLGSIKQSNTHPLTRSQVYPPSNKYHLNEDQMSRNKNAKKSRKHLQQRATHPQFHHCSDFSVLEYFGYFGNF